MSEEKRVISLRPEIEEALLEAAKIYSEVYEIEHSPNDVMERLLDEGIRVSDPLVYQILSARKEQKERKVVSIYYSDWKRLKQYAAENDTTITSVIAKLVEDSTIM